ncbi:MAG: phage tail tape measure protein [Pseudolabrys sp.]
MSDSYFMDEKPTSDPGGGTLPNTVDKTQKSVTGLGISATAFANAMTKAFTQATAGGKQFDDVLKSMALKLSSMTVAAAFKPVAKGFAGSLKDLLNSVFGGTGGTTGGDGKPTPDSAFASALSSIQPFASGGVIGAPSYFPLSGGLGLAGEAGPEAIMPLTRGADGRLGVAMAGGVGRATISVQIATPDAASFRRSEAYITGQIARAVARGQRSL